MVVKTTIEAIRNTTKRGEDATAGKILAAKATAVVGKPRSLEDHVAVRIVRIAEIMQRLATRTIEARWGLRNTDLRILNLLDGDDGVALSEISRRAHVDKAWISRSIQHLVRKGLLQRRAAPADSRLALVSLTARGQALLDEVRPQALWHERRLLKNIDARGFKRELDRLLANAEALLEERSQDTQ